MNIKIIQIIQLIININMIYQNFFFKTEKKLPLNIWISINITIIKTYVPILNSDNSFSDRYNFHCKLLYWEMTFIL